MARKDAMNDRIVRHAMKLFDRLDQYLNDGSAVHVPASVESELDGRHAEIRIIQSAQFDDDTHHAPSGTKYPCAGCHLYFVEEGKKIGVEMGPMWVTAPALSTQLAGKKLNDLEDVEGVGQQIVDQYAAEPDDAERRTARRRGPGPSHASTSAMLASPPADTTDYDYDGDSEMS